MLELVEIPVTLLRWPDEDDTEIGDCDSAGIRRDESRHVLPGPGARPRRVLQRTCARCASPSPITSAHPPNRLGVGGLEEGGLHGLLHRNFAKNNKIFLYRSVAGTRKEVAKGVFWGEFHLSSFTLDPQTNLLDLSSEKVLLKVPAEWDYCCHYGGDLDYLPDGTITLTVGDDVDAASSGGYGPRDKTRRISTVN